MTKQPKPKIIAIRIECELSELLARYNIDIPKTARAALWREVKRQAKAREKIS